jgi:hypothetical protein
MCVCVIGAFGKSVCTIVVGLSSSDGGQRPRRWTNRTLAMPLDSFGAFSFLVSERKRMQRASKPAANCSCTPEAQPIRYCPGRSRSGSERTVGRSFRSHANSRWCSALRPRGPAISSSASAKAEFAHRLHPREHSAPAASTLTPRKRAQQTLRN